MGYLKAIRCKAVATLEELKASVVQVNETPELERYETAKKLFDADDTIRYFHFFSETGTHPHPITRESVEYYMTKKYYENVKSDK